MSKDIALTSLDWRQLSGVVKVDLSQPKVDFTDIINKKMTRYYKDLYRYLSVPEDKQEEYLDNL